MSKLIEYIQDSVEKIPFDTAVVYREKETYEAINYIEFMEKIDSLAYYLKPYKNKTIAIIGGNKLPYLVSLVAVLGYIGDAFLIDKDLKEQQMELLFRTLSPDLIIWDEEFLRGTESFLQRIPSVCFNQIDCWMKDQKQYVDPKHAGALILHTSGTTGIPKCLKMTETNYTYIIDALNVSWKVFGGHSVFFIIPLYHIYALTSLFHSFYSKSSVILEWDYKRLDVALSLTHPSIFLGVPLIFKRIYQKVMGDHLADILDDPKICQAIHDKVSAYFGNNYYFSVSGGSIADPDIMTFFEKIGLPVYNGYGMTETSGPVAICFEGNNEVHSVGKILKNEVRIDQTDENGIGEICFAGDNIVTHYLGDSQLEIKDRFFHTGDLGYVKNGFLYITGRKKEILIGDNGKNIAVREITDPVLAHPMIHDCMLSMKENRICALVDTDLDLHDVKAWISQVNEGLPKYKQIYEVKIIRKGIHDESSCD